MYVLDQFLRLLHPFMPFITEEIWQKLPGNSSEKELKSLMVAPWPKAQKFAFIGQSDEEDMTAIMSVIKTIRNLRAEVGALPGKKSEVIVGIEDARLKEIFVANEKYIISLGAAEPVKFIDGSEEKPQNAVTGVADAITVYLPLLGLIDVEKETAKLQKELQKIIAETEKLTKKLGNEAFLQKAPPNVVAGEKEKLVAYGEKQKTVQKRIDELNALKEQKQ